MSIIEASAHRTSNSAVDPKLLSGRRAKSLRAFFAIPVLALIAVAFLLTAAAEAQESKTLRIGIIGLDTSHVGAFTNVLNDPKAEADVAGCRVVAAYPKGSPDIESSTKRVPGYTADMKKRGVKIVDSIEDLIGQVDAVLLETNDGRPHLEQVLPVLKAGKPVFIDKPIAGSLEDAIAIFAASKHYKTPVFSSSSLRYAEHVSDIRDGKIGDVLGAHAYSPAHLEKTHPDLYWYGIHGVELLYSVMGEGCQSVVRSTSNDFDVVTGTWDNGRIGVFRGIRKGKSGYGGTAFGAKGIHPVGPYRGYRPLVVEIVKFFKTGKQPVPDAETLEIYTFMEAADESKRRDGAPVSMKTTLETAKLRADAKLKSLLD
jgi:predicted dehydrogenase